MVSASAISTTSISLFWTEASTLVESYEIVWMTADIGGCSGGSDMDSTTITGGSTSYVIRGLEEDSSYTITVTASNSAGSSEDTVTAVTLEAGKRQLLFNWSQDCIIYIHFPAPSAPPTSVSVSEVTPFTITVQWGPVDCIHRNGEITGYTLEATTSTELDRRVDVASSAREATVSGLTPFTEYTVSVAAVNSAGTGVYSSRITIRTKGKYSGPPLIM